MSKISVAAAAPPSARLRVLAAGLVLISAICFSGKAVLVKLAYRYDIDSVSLLALRMLFSLPFFVANTWIGRRRYLAKGGAPLADAGHWLAVGALGLSGYYLASLFDFMGLQYVTAGLERLILFLYPTLVLLLTALFFRKRVSRAQYIALALTYGGIALALLDKTHAGHSANLPLGAALVFLSGLMYAIYMVGSSRYISIMGPLYYTSAAMLAATAAILIHYGFSSSGDFDALWRHPAGLYGLVAIMAVFSTVLPTLLVSVGIRIIGAGNTAIISSVGPVATIGMGYVFLGETFGGWQIPGTALVLAGVLWISLAKEKP